MKRNEILALDSARSFDENGYMHVAVSHITKAQVAPYRGSEIPGWEEAGLSPDEIYYAYRSPEELELSVSTWNGIPLHIEHHVDSADDPQKLSRVGAVGTGAVWNPPYIDNSLVIWDAEAIRRVEDGSCRQLSCAYRYEPDFTPGETEDGIHYDFVMRDIRGNHVALVEEGRAGKDVVVADSALSLGDNANFKASDNSMPNSGGRSDSLKMDKDKLVEMNEVGTDGVPAGELEPDISVSREMEPPIEDDDGGMSAPNVPDMPKEPELPVADDGEEIIQAVLEEIAGLEQEKRDKIRALLVKLKAPAKGMDAAPESAPAPEHAPAPEGGQEEQPVSDEGSMPLTNVRPEEKKMPAMDSVKRIKEALMADFKRRYAAAKAVRPVCGEIDPMAFDSAEAIYGRALTQAGINIRKYPKNAYEGMFAAYNMSRANSKAGGLAADSKPAVMSGAFAGLNNITIGE